MKRRNLIVLAFLLAGCDSKPKNLSALLPGAAGGWIRQQVVAMPLDEAPEAIRRAGIVQWASTDYSHEGKGRVTVSISEMRGETSAFELQQRVHEPDSINFYKGALFVVVKRGTAEPADARAFARALEASLTAGR
jgi:hypothetical protein